MKNLLLVLSFAVAFNVSAAVVQIDIVETTDPTLDAEFLDAGVSSYDVNTGLYWLNFSDLVAGDLTLGYSVTNNQEWFGPQGWRLPTYTEVYTLFDTFFVPEFVDSGDGTMVIENEGDGTSAIIQSRNSWLMGFGTDATETTGSNIPSDAIINSIGLYLDEDDVVQMMGVEFDVLNLVTTIYGMDYDRTDLDTETAYAKYGVFMVYDAVVPIPAAIWLFGSGLIGLLFVSRRKLN